MSNIDIETTYEGEPLQITLELTDSQLFELVTKALRAEIAVMEGNAP